MEECYIKVGTAFDQFHMIIRCSAIYFLEVGARVSLKVATKGSIRCKKTLKIEIFPKFFLSENGAMQPKSLNYF